MDQASSFFEQFIDDYFVECEEHLVTIRRALLRLEQGAEAQPMQVNQSTEPLYIIKPFSGGGIAKLFSTHPPTEERVRRLRQMRPAIA